jgi:hypothetical protein
MAAAGVGAFWLEFISRSWIATSMRNFAAVAILLSLQTIDGRGQTIIVFGVTRARNERMRGCSVVGLRCRSVVFLCSSRFWPRCTLESSAFRLPMTHFPRRRELIENRRASLCAAVDPLSGVSEICRFLDKCRSSSTLASGVDRLPGGFSAGAASSRTRLGRRRARCGAVTMSVLIETYRGASSGEPRSVRIIIVPGPASEIAQAFCVFVFCARTKAPLKAEPSGSLTIPEITPPAAA